MRVNSQRMPLRKGLDGMKPKGFNGMQKLFLRSEMKKLFDNAESGGQL